MKKLTLPVCCLVLNLMNCDEKDPGPSEIIINGNLESGVSFPTKWYNHDGYGKYEATWNDQTFKSGTRSVSIKSETSVPVDFAFWAQQICDNIPIGKRLVLRAQVKGNLTGTGISVALRADESATSNTGLAFETTQGNVSITGTFDWSEHGVEMLSVPDNAKCLYVFLIMLPNTTGEVYFDDISLAYED